MGAFVVIATGAVAVPAQAAPTLIQVSTTVDAPVAADCYDGVPGTSLRQALCLADASPEAVVVLPPGTFPLTAGPLVVDPGGPLDLTLHGPGASMATIDAGGVSRVLDVDPSLTGGVHLTVEGVTLRGGVGEPGTGGGGAVLAGTGDPTAPDSLTLRDCAVTANRNAPAGTALPSDVGGAVSMTGGALLVERCVFTGNTASGAAGGAIGYSGVGGADTVEVVGSSFTGNTVEAAAATAATGGGALDVAWGAPTTTVRDTRFETNELRTGTRPARGSAVRVAAGTATLEGVTVRRNQAVGGTGSTAAVHLAAGTVSDSVVVGNVTDVGGVQSRAGVAGASSAVRTWWGCTDLAGACDSAGGATVTPFATIATSLAPAAAVAGQEVTATVTVGLSDGSASTPALRTAMTGAPVTWSGATFTAEGTALGAAGTAQASLTAAGSATVSATVDGASAGAALTVAVPPAVADEPVDATVSEGAAATFTATATGTPAPTVQWQVRQNTDGSWFDVVGETSTTFTTETLVRGDHGTQVRAVFTSSAGTATTRAASVTVTYGPEDVTGPGDAAGLVGSVVTFSASAAGRPTPTVRWQTSPDGTTWADVAGATSWTYSRTLLAGDEGLRVRAVVSGAGGDVPTSSAGVTLQSAPTVSAQPTDVAVLPNGTATFVVGVSGVPAPTVAWERRAPGGSWQAVPGSSTTLTLAGVPLADHGTQLRATLTNLHGSVTSDAATLSVFHGPVVTQHPADVTGVVGDDVTFTVAAQGHPAPTVQWQTSTNGMTWTSVPGATGWTWTRTLTTADDGLQVRAWVTGHGGSEATSTASVTARYAPTVTAPADAAVTAGEDASFAVTVTGSPAPTVTWQRRAAGAVSWTDAGTGSSLDLEAVTPADDGTQVRAVVTNTQGTVTSAAATLTVRWAPTFTQQPAATTVPAGGVATFTAAGNGNPTPVVQWQTSTDGTTWADVPGATSWTYARTTTVADDGLRVRVVASGWTGAVTSSAALLTVEHAPTITTQPEAVSVLAGADATFTVTVTGNPEPTVAWQTQAPGGAWTSAGTGASLTLTDLEPADGGTLVRAVVTNTRGSVTSDDVELDVRWAPVFTAHPADVTGLADDEVTFTATATGNPAVSPTWQTSPDGTSWTTVPGATGWTYTRTLADADHGLRVRAVATNAEGVTPSGTATVTVDAPPAITTQPTDATVDLGTSATFEVAVTGRPAPTLQWQTEVDGDWVDVLGAMGTTLVVPGTQDAHGARYRVVATNVRGTVTSAVVTLDVLLPPTVSDPQDVATAPDEDVTFSVDVTGRPLPDVTWETSGDGGVTWTPAGAGTTLTLTPSLLDDGVLVRAVATATLVSGPVSVTSAAAELVVAAVPEVLDGPAPRTSLTAGVPTTFRWTVLAADATALWEVSRDGGATWTPVPVGWTPGTQAALMAARAAGPAVRTVHTLALTPTVADAGALVRLTVTSPGGSASASTVLDVVAVPDPGAGGGGTGGPAGPGSAGGPPGTGSTGTGSTGTGSTGTGSTGTGSTGAALPRTGVDPLRLLALAALIAAAGVVTAVGATRRRELRA